MFQNFKTKMADPLMKKKNPTTRRKNNNKKYFNGKTLYIKEI